ncbi:MAG: hypothetical protein A2096_12030 [Spirochaetes bacterium GWF1_41_5]|nr:MAG: hypothetical protein A2096_12030 [Spirochaetes bacterium GWF1_41_5]HBE01834.1 hypothetical protein [Spirochaetia bacterium]
MALPYYGDQKNAELIEKLVQAEAVPLSNIIREQEILLSKNTAWEKIKKEFSTLGSYASELYGFSSVFKKFRGSSSAPHIAEIIPGSGAVPGNFSLEVKEAARAHRLSSRALKEDEKFPESEVTLANGYGEITLRFPAGNLASFLAIMKKKEARELFSAETVQRTAKEKIIVIQSVKTGAASRIRLVKDSANLFINMDFFKTGKNEKTDFATSAKTYNGAISGKNSFTLPPGSGITIPLPAEKSAFSFLTAWQRSYNPALPADKLPEQKPDPGMKLDSFDLLEFEEIRLPSLPPSSFPAPLAEEPAVQKTQAADVISAVYGKVSSAETDNYFNLPDDFSRLPRGESANRFPAEGSAIINEITFWNSNSFCTIEIKNPEIISDSGSSGFIPANPVTEPSDSKINYNGIDIVRPDNEISDCIEGAVISVKNAGREQISLNIELDRESVKNALINFTGQYNILMHFLNRVLATQAVSADLSEEEKKLHGMFQSEITLKLITGKLRTIMMNAYETSYGKNLALLSQLGISTPRYGSYDQQADSGKLEMNEKMLDAKLGELGSGVGELFGFSLSKTGVIDSGCAFQTAEAVRPYTQPAGIIAKSIELNKNKHAQLEKKAGDFQKHLAGFRLLQQKKFAELEKAQKEMENTSKWLNNSLQSK